MVLSVVILEYQTATFQRVCERLFKFVKGWHTEFIPHNTGNMQATARLIGDFPHYTPEELAFKIGREIEIEWYSKLLKEKP